jgi:hypothetical protein
MILSASMPSDNTPLLSSTPCKLFRTVMVLGVITLLVLSIISLCNGMFDTTTSWAMFGAACGWGLIEQALRCIEDPQQATDQCCNLLFSTSC